MFCIECGVKLPAGAKFCSACGTPAAVHSEMPQTREAQDMRQPGIQGVHLPQMQQPQEQEYIPPSDQAVSESISSIREMLAASAPSYMKVEPPTPAVPSVQQRHVQSAQTVNAPETAAAAPVPEVPAAVVPVPEVPVAVPPLPEIPVAAVPDIPAATPVPVIPAAVTPAPNTPTIAMPDIPAAEPDVASAAAPDVPSSDGRDAAGFEQPGYAPPEYTPDMYGQPAYAPPLYAPPMYEPPMYGVPQKPAGSIFVRVVFPILFLILLTIVFTFVVFLIVDGSPGDPARLIAGASATEEEVAQFRRDLGLDEPMLERYFRVLTGDFGMSFLTRRPVNDDIAARLPYTLILMLGGIIVTFVFAIPLGILSGVMHNKVADVLFSIVTVICKAIPFFWIGLLLIKWFAVDLMLLPVAGIETWTGYILPIITLGFIFFGFAMQAIRASVIKARSNDGTGLFFPGDDASERRTVLSMILPTVAKSGLQLGWMFGGIIFVEIIFSIPAVGGYFLFGLMSRDTPAILGSIMTLSLLFIVASVIFELAISGVSCIFRAKARKRLW